MSGAVMAEAFQPRFVDLVRNYTTTNGTADFVLGTAVNGFTGFASALSVGDRFYYSATGIDRPSDTEVGRGTLLANGVIRREPISGPKTQFGPGTKTVALVAAAEWFNDVQAGGGQSGEGVGAVQTRAALSAAPIGAPVQLTEAGRSGLFTFDGANLSAMVAADTAQGIYVARSTDPSGASGAWVRSVAGAADPRWWGVQPGAGKGAANSAARDAMFATLRARATTVLAQVQTIEPIRFSADTYEFSSTFELTDGTFIIEGSGHGHTGGVGTSLNFPAGVTGIRVQGITTSGATATRASGRGADGTIIRNLTIMGAVSGNSDAYGIHLRACASIDHCHVDRFNGDGIYVAGFLSGNANVWQINTVTVVNCRNGIYVDGLDANAGTCIAASVTENRQWGIWDSSFLGNTYIGCHAATNASGPYKTDDPSATNLFLNCYAEADQPASSFTYPTMVVGGAHGPGTGSYPGHIAVGIGGQIELTGKFQATQPITSNQAVIVEGGGGGPQTIRAGGAGSKLVLEETGGSLGTARLTLSAEVGALGATFETTHASAQLIDFAFLTTAAGAHGIRYERRAGNFLHPGASNWEFQFGSPGAASHAIGDGGLRITGSGVFSGNLSAPNLSGTNSGDQFTSIGQGSFVGRAAGAGSGAAGTLTGAQAKAILGIAAADIAVAGANKVIGASSAGPGVELGLSGGLSISGGNLTLAAITPASLAATGAVTSSGGGMGYSTGAGGTVTQSTNKSTAVTLNKLCGQVTLNNAALAANTTVTFTLTNSNIAAGDLLILNHAAGGTAGAYNLNAQCGAGSATINVRNITTGSLSEAIVIAFAIQKAVTA